MDTRITRLPGGLVEIRYSDGSYYKGEYLNNRISGQGRMEYADGRIYEGGFDDGRWDGYGDAYFPSNDSRYEGDWSLNLREGYGQTTYYNKDGSIFAQHYADYHNDIIDGKLRSEFQDGTVVTGDHFKGFSATGPVVIRYGFDYYDPNLRNCVYEGDVVYMDNWYRKEGRGKLTDSKGTVFEGRFAKDKREGTFTVTYKDGRRETAEFRDDKKVAAYGAGVKSAGAKSTAGAKSAATQKKADDWRKKIDSSKYLVVNYSGNEKYSDEIEPYFEGIIGMESVKDQLDRMYKRFKIDAMRHATLGISTGKQGYYFIITGNPGTGKTNVARIIGRMLHDLGILEGEVFVEVDRGKLVGQYIGQTAIKTAEVIESARGGTLFIDEAYNIFRKDDEKDFGSEAIDTLLKDMEDHRGEYCCILAGYEDRMDNLIKYANPGLASRFDHKINIEDYSDEELCDILVTMAGSKYFYIKKDAKPVILELFRKEKGKPTFANARFARKILDEAIEAQAMRLSEILEKGKVKELKAEELQTLEAADFMEADGL